MYSFKYFLILIFIIKIDIFPQWNKADINTSTGFYSVYYDGSFIYAGGISFLYFSTNQGQTWRRNIPVPELEDEITDIIRINNRLFVGTFNKGVFETTDFGATWIDRNAGLGEMGANYISKFVRRGDSLYVGTNGAGIFVLNLQNSLPTWLPFRNGMPLNISSNVYSLINHKNRLIAGAGGNCLVYTNDWGSNNWNNYSFDGFNGSFHPMNSLLSYGNTIFGSSLFGIFRSTTSGNTWQKFNPENGIVELNSITTISSDIYIFRSKTNGLTFIYKSTNSGTSWELIDSFSGVYIHDATSVGYYLYTAREDGLYYLNTATSSVDDNLILNKFSLSQNYPNPFNPVTEIRYQITEDSKVMLKVYDLLGNEVVTLLNEFKEAGSYSITFDANGITSGVYFYTLSAVPSTSTEQVFTETKKMLLMK